MSTSNRPADKEERRAYASFTDRQELDPGANGQTVLLAGIIQEEKKSGRKGRKKKEKKKRRSYHAVSH